MLVDDSLEYLFRNLWSILLKVYFLKEQVIRSLNFKLDKVFQVGHFFQSFPVVISALLRLTEQVELSVSGLNQNKT